jgi:hypothetical protein
VKAEFALNLADCPTGWLQHWHSKGEIQDGHFIIRNVKSGHDDVVSLETMGGKIIKIVLLNDADSLALQKIDGKVEFEKLQKISSMKIKSELLQPAGPLREIPFSTGKSPIAIAPTDADFTNAAVWKITLPANLDLKLNPLLRIHYTGDVARLTLNGKLIDDNFYAGRTFDLGLNRYAPEILTGDLRLEILPLRKDAPIYLEPKDRPDFGSRASIATVQNVEIINRHEVESTPATP